MEYDELVLKTFIENQLQLFPEIVVDSLDEAEFFLEDCMAVVCKNKKEVREYFEEAGLDIYEMSEDELFEQSEIFAIPDGRYLVVEG